MNKGIAVLVSITVIAASVLLLWRPRHSPPAEPTTGEQAVGLPPLPTAISEASADLPVVTWAAQAKSRFEPCGCVAGMNGGLMRRAALLSRLPPERVLSLELGGWSAGKQGYERLRAGFYLRGLAKAGIDALAIGGDEVALGGTELAAHLALAREAGLGAVCANLDVTDGSAGWKPWLLVTAGGRRFLITAVVPRDAAGSGLSVRDPAESLAAAAAEAAARDAQLVCMADLEPEACTGLAQAVPQVALVIGGRSDHPSPEPRAVGNARVLWAGNHGKVVGWWAWGSPQAAFELLKDGLPSDPAQRELLTAYQRALGDAAFDNVAGSGMVALDGNAGWAGSSTCKACHAGPSAIHAGSLHHQALASLQRRGYQHDPDCLRCHVTGLGEGGYRRGDTVYAEVGCESCHGRGAGHVSAALAGRAASAPMPPVSPSACVVCHDPDNSPKFDYATYWPKIRHTR